MVKTSAPQPQPVPQFIVCSLCGEPWAGHGDDPTTLDCIRLLKAKVRPSWQWQPNWTYTLGAAAGGSWSNSNGNVVAMTPRDAQAS